MGKLENAEWRVGDRVFFNHETDAWTPGEVAEVTSQNKRIKYICKSTNGTEHKIDEADVFRLTEGWETAKNDDLLDLHDLHESTMLHCAKNRYMEDKIYVSSFYRCSLFRLLLMTQSCCL
jgi:myosin heavy subunit